MSIKMVKLFGKKESERVKGFKALLTYAVRLKSDSIQCVCPM